MPGSAAAPRRVGNGAARRFVLGLGALSVCGAGTMQYCEAKAKHANKNFNIVKRAQKYGTVSPSDVSEVVNRCEDAEVVSTCACILGFVHLSFHRNGLCT